MELDLTTEVAKLNRVGKVLVKRLEKLGIYTVNDLLGYYPFRWDDLSHICQIGELQAGATVTIKAKISLINSRRSPVKRKFLTEALVEDDSGSLKVIWFNQPFLSKILSPGDPVYLSGKVDFDHYNLQLVNPVYEKAIAKDTTHTARIVPIYSLTQNLTQKQLRFLIKSVMPLTGKISEWLPEQIIKQYHLLNLKEAIKQVHFPISQEILDQAINRLKFDELLAFMIQVNLAKQELGQSQAKTVTFEKELTNRFVASLPYKLTDDQRRAAWQIISDLEKEKPMNRLLQGDVGCGKTVVAALAMLNVAAGGGASALMVPTEILAYQHYQNLSELFSQSDLDLVLLTKSQVIINGKEAKKALAIKILSQSGPKIVVGTQALIQEAVSFDDLRLVIIDEQHRFGVKQRQLLKEKLLHQNYLPHFLSMTATPIPRSLALTIYGDLDISLIRQQPKNRKKIITRVVASDQRGLAYDFINKQIASGRQVFVVCPLIDPSDKLGVKSVTEEHQRLKKEVFPKLQIGLLHGKLKSAEKEKVMADFLAGKYDLLVTTSVVEVGVDVPNASVMVIEGAERFGLAQLHQFRGRVGRSDFQSYCFLFSESDSIKTGQRLMAMLSAKDGFELAEYDLKFRGPGQVYGIIQSGYLNFKIAQLSDYQIMLSAKAAAQELVGQGLSRYPLVKQKMQLLLQNIHFE